MAKHTDQASDLTFYLNKTKYHASKIFKDIAKKESMDSLKEASKILQVGGYGVLGLDGLVSLLKYKELAERDNLDDYEKNIKNSLLADIGAKLGSASAGITSIFGTKAMKEALKSSQSVAGVSVDVLGSIFTAAYGVLIGANLIRAYAVNKKVNEADYNITQYVEQNIGDSDLNASFKQLSKEEQNSLIEALAKNSPDKIDNSSAKQVYNHLSNKTEFKQELRKKYKTLDKFKFKRNGYLQTSVAYGVCLGIGLAALAFPPSGVIIAATAIASVSLKLGWDFYRRHVQAKKEKQLDNLQENTLKQIKVDSVEPTIPSGEEDNKSRTTQLFDNYKAILAMQRAAAGSQNAIPSGRPPTVNHNDVSINSDKLSTLKLNEIDNQETPSMRLI